MDKKERIIHAALSEFKKNGIDKTKISDIVKEAGVAQGTYYLYFSSKFSIMPAIAEVMVEKTLETIKGTVNEDELFSVKLEQFVEGIFAITKEYQEVHALIYAGLASTEHIKEWENVYEPFYKWVSHFLENAKQAGDIRETINTKRTSKLIIGLVESAAEQVYLYDTAKKQQAEEQKEEVLVFLKHGLDIK